MTDLIDGREKNKLANGAYIRLLVTLFCNYFNRHRTYETVRTELGIAYYTTRPQITLK